MPNPVFANRTRGASALAYGLLIGLISVVALASVASSGSSIDSLFTTTSTTLSDVVTQTAQAPAPAPTAEPTQTPDGVYLVVGDSTLSATLQSELGDESTWTLCHETLAGDAWPGHAVINTACGSANETLQIDEHGSTWSGAYVATPLGDEYYSNNSMVWEYPAGFYFSSAPGRGGSVYDHTGAVTSTGVVRIEFGNNSSNRFHINAYKYASQTSHNYYHSNGNWTPQWNLVDGTNTTPTVTVHTRIYSR